MSEIWLTDKKIVIEDVSKRVESDGNGAVVTFAGNVRNNNLNQRVLYLEYETYAPLAEKQMRQIAEDAEKRWNVTAAIAHRTGRLEIGECSVCVAVGSAHRGAAFDACRWIMDTLKTTVPIWKKEFFDGGAHWIEGPGVVPTNPEKEESETPTEP